jgi:hypothetical protein
MAEITGPEKMTHVYNEATVGPRSGGQKVRKKTTLQICIRKRANKRNRKGGRLPGSLMEYITMYKKVLIK